MTTLKRCPCGEVPESVDIQDAGQGGKWAFAVPSCCGEWMIEFKTQYKPLDSPECEGLADAAWNNAPRGDSEAIPDHICGLCYHPKQEADCCDRDDCDIRGKTPTTKEKAE